MSCVVVRKYYLFDESSKISLERRISNVVAYCYNHNFHIDFQKIHLKKMTNRLVYVLLPICYESEHDVYFNLLKNIVFRVGRAKLADHYVDNAFKSGMVDKEIHIDDDDVSFNWKNLNSKREIIRVSRLLGHWSTVHCPTFGKIFFGDSWKAPNESSVKVVSSNGTRKLNKAEIKAIISPKMKCYVVQLNVSESTLSNLKNFIKVPINEIELENERQISPKMKAFDIKEDYVEKCWAALRRGEWLLNFDTEVRKTN